VRLYLFILIFFNVEEEGAEVNGLTIFSYQIHFKQDFVYETGIGA
jgi:hypothetical protein